MSSTDKENTARILRGQSPIQSLKCRLGWHRWTSWEHQLSTINRQTFDGYPEMIRCYCADCGLVRIEYPYSRTINKKKS